MVPAIVEDPQDSVHGAADERHGYDHFDGIAELDPTSTEHISASSITSARSLKPVVSHRPVRRSPARSCPTSARRAVRALATSSSSARLSRRSLDFVAYNRHLVGDGRCRGGSSHPVHRASRRRPGKIQAAAEIRGPLEAAEDGSPS